MSRLRRNRLALAGALLLVGLGLVAVCAPWLAPQDPFAIDLPQALLAPSRAHWLGTDQLGRDVLSRMIYGTRISLIIGFVAVGVAVLVGTAVGALSGFYGGRVDWLLMRFVDTMLSIPSVFLLLAVISILGPNIYNIMAIIGLTSWMGVARLVRAEILSLKEREFILAARVLGASSLRIITRHLLPNAMAPVLVAATLGVGGAILTESALSFLGLGVQPPAPSWGNIINEGRIALGVAWWLTIYPGLAILVTVLAFNLLGEGIRDAILRSGD